MADDQTVQPSPMEGVEIRHGATMRLPDGTVLVADIYTPRGDGPYPVLLMRQPYGRDIASTVVYAQPTWFCRNNFIVVVQDVRGRGDSGGDFYAFRNEAEDGYHTVAWAAGLPKSNGSVGMYGFSYQGSTQLLAASLKPPALKAIAPHMTAFDLYSGWFYRGGLLQQMSTLGWGNQMLREDARRKKHWALYEALETVYAQPGSLAKAFPVYQVSPLTDPEANPYVRDWLSHDTKDDYWAEFDFLSRLSEVCHVPCFHLAGWHDFYTRGSMDGYRAMQAVSPGLQKLVVGPWGHIPWGTVLAGRRLGEAARLNVDDMLVQWMRRWCGDGAPVDTGPAVSYFSMGDLTWRASAQWPPENARETTFFLGSRGSANAIFGDGTLREEADSSETMADRFVYDPEVPVLGPGTRGTAYEWGPVDLYPSQQGNNLLVYRTAPFLEARSFAGQPTCRLHVQSTARHTAFVARLSIKRGESCEFLCLGAVRVFPNQFNGDSVANVEIMLDDIAFSILPGEALVLDVASSAFPLLIRHPNTADSPSRVSGPEAFVRATQVVLHDERYPSALTLAQVTADLE